MTSPEPLPGNEELRAIVLHALPQGAVDKLEPRVDFWDLGLDSLGLVQIINDLEATFNITIEDDELDQETFSCLESISKYLEQKLTG